ncbi:MAG: methylmalonyl-CoA mutase family protein, partial [Elusimicrobiota bacterium]
MMKKQETRPETSSAAPFDDSARFVTPSGIEIKRVYGPPNGPDTRDPAYEAEKLGSAGRPPYTRGIQETMYRG